MRVKAVLTFLVEDAAWSELLYFQVSSFAAAKERMELIIDKRVRILANGGIIKKLRLRDVEVRGRGQLFVVNRIGLAGPPDAPWMSGEIVFNTAGGSKRAYRLPGIPDTWTEGGHLAGAAIVAANPPQSVKNRFEQFAETLIANQAQIAFYSRGEAKKDILAVDGNGNVHLVQTITLAVGDTVQFYRTSFFGGRENVKGRWRVETVDVDTHKFKLLHWPTGRTVQKGQLFKIVTDYANMETYSIGDTVSRKTGRPSGRQVGRRSIRR